VCVGKDCFGGYWAVVDTRLVITFNFGGFGVEVIEFLRSWSSIFSEMSSSYECWPSVSSTSGGFYLTSAWHQGYRVQDNYQLRWELKLRVWGFSILFFSCRRWDCFLFLTTYLSLEQSRRSADGIGFGICIASRFLSDSSWHFKGNGWGVLKECQKRWEGEGRVSCSVHLS
jgi:hypothetical protein